MLENNEIMESSIRSIMKKKGVNRKNAIMRLIGMYAILTATILVFYFVFPLDGLAIGRRSSELSLGNFVLFCSALTAVMGAWAGYLFYKEKDKPDSEPAAADANDD